MDHMTVVSASPAATPAALVDSWLATSVGQLSVSCNFILFLSFLLYIYFSVEVHIDLVGVAQHLHPASTLPLPAHRVL